MKINQIQIKNIASLKGHHSINFEELTEHSKTIAITGETGSGKSSILNSIAIALFGKCHKDNFSQTDLVTLGEEEGEVRLNFEFSNSIYMATWKCRVRKKNKELLKKPNITRSLIHLLPEKEIELDMMPEDLINLSFDQFTKTIILNQGQFSEFLLSSFSDRKKILESLLSNFDLTDLSVKSKRNLKEIESDLKLIESKIEGLKGQQSLNKEDIQNLLMGLKKQLKELKEKKDEFTSYNDKLTELIKTINSYNSTDRDIQKSKEKINVLTESYNKALNLSEKNEESFKEKDHKASTILKALNKTKSTKVELAKTKEQIDQTSNLLANTKKQTIAKEETKERFSLEILKIKRSLSSLVVDENISIEKSDELDKIHEGLTKSKHTLDVSNNKDVAINKTLTLLKTEQNQQNASMKMLINKLSTIENTEDLSASKEQLKQLNVQKENLYSQLENQKTISKEIDKNTSDIQTLEKSYKNEDEQLKDVTFKLDMIKDAIKANDLEQKISELISASLKKGKCVICDNEKIHHLNSAKEKKNNDYNIELQKALSRHESVQKSSVQLKTKIDILSQKQDDLKAKLDDTQTTESQYSIIKDTITKVQLKIEENTKAIAIKDELTKSLTTSKNKIQDLHKSIQQTNDEKLKNDIVIKDQKNKAKLLELSLEGILGTSITYDPFELKKIINNLKEKETLNLRLSNGQKALDENEKEIIELEKQQNTLEEQQDTYKLEKSALESSIPSHYVSIDIDKKIHEIEVELTSQKNLLYKLKQELNDKKISQAQEQSRHNMLAEQMSAYESQFITKKTDFEETKNLTLLKLKNKLNDLNSIDQINSQLLEEALIQIVDSKELYTKNFIELREKISNQSLLLDQAIKTEELIKDSKDEINKLLEKKATAEQLYKLLGKDEFRNYVLSIVEKNLIRSTNHQLNQLCQGRYILEQKINPSNSSSEYYIIDKLNFSMQRKVSTLSGGETFMVSLAMALALSDITRGENIIDSFFIDEGFGTLDEDSIEEVLEMLNTIKSQGKTITLISHIKEITSRIPVNIQVQKLETGSSRIRTLFQ